MIKLYRILALCLVVAMAWANHRGFMFSSLFNDSDPAIRSGSSQASHK